MVIILKLRVNSEMR